MSLFLKSIKLNIIYFTFSQAERVSRSSLTSCSCSHTLVRNPLRKAFFFDGEGPNHLANHDMETYYYLWMLGLSSFSDLFFFIYTLPSSFLTFLPSFLLFFSPLSFLPSILYICIHVCIFGCMYVLQKFSAVSTSGCSCPASGARHISPFLPHLLHSSSLFLDFSPYLLSLPSNPAYSSLA